MTFAALFVLVTGVSAHSDFQEQTITVCNVGCDHRSLGEAIAAANDGDLIQLDRGVFTEMPMTLNKSLRLRGQGIGITFVRNGDPANALLHVTGAAETRVSISDMTLDSRCTTLIQACVGDGVVVSGQATLDLSNVSVAEYGGAGLRAQDSAQVNVDSSTLSDNGLGLLVAGAARVSVAFSSVEANAVAVEVQGADAAYLDVSNSSISNNVSGVRVLLGEAGQAAQASVEMFNVQIGNNGGDGFIGTGSVAIRNSTVLFNGGSGVVFFGSGTLELFQNRIFINTENGIDVDCAVSVMCARIIENEVFRNGVVGLNTEPTMIVECRNNFIHDNPQDFSSDALAQTCS